ncbi:MAG: hypothetical protein M3T56_02080 [Chloroflexota bacterium]|nr:hypothetical protein [Chloroflexota bacterium]
MPDNPLAAYTDDELVNLSKTEYMQAASVTVEMMRRLRVSLREFGMSADTWSRRLVWMTAVLIGLTFVLVVVGIETAYLAWVLLARG